MTPRARAAARYLAGVLLLAGVYYAAGRASLALQYTGPVAAIWLPVGVGAATLYLAGLRWAPGIVIGDLALGDFSLPTGTVLGFTAGNVADILIIVVLLRQLLGSRAAMDELQQVGGMVVAVAAGAATTATVAMLSLRAGGAVELADVPELWRSWFLADASGALVVTPLALAWAHPPSRTSRRRALEGALILLAVVGLSAIALTGDLSQTYLVFPALIWAALRFGVQGATLAVAVTALITIGVTANEVGPFVAQSITESVLSTQLYIAVAALTTLSLAAIVSERRRASAEARRLAEEQSALRRVATVVARGVRPGAELAVVAEEVGRLLECEIVTMNRVGPDDTVTAVAAWSKRGEPVVPVGTSHDTLEGVSVTAMIAREGRPARIDDFTDVPGPIAADTRARGIRSTVGSPIIVEGRVWGALLAESTRPEPQPADTERRLVGFTELVGTAIANAHAGAQVRRLADEQAALRRVATHVARGLHPGEEFAVVAEEAGRLLEVDIVNMMRFDRGDTATVVAAWSRRGDHVIPVGSTWVLEGLSASALIARTRRPARVDDFTDAPGPLAAEARKRGIRSTVGSPIMVEGRVWGAMLVESTHPGPLPADTETHLAGFTELAATAVANAHAGAQVRRLADEQAALRRVATLVAKESAPADLFAAVAQEVGRVLQAGMARMLRYEPDGSGTVVAAWQMPGINPVGSRLSLDGDSVAARVLRSGQSARMDGYAGAPGTLAATLRKSAIRTAVGAPITAEGRLWGVVIAATSRADPLPPDSETRIAEFTELVATAIANAHSREELTASRARVVAAGDKERRRIERNLHDGAQQRLISIGLHLRLVADTPDRELADRLSRIGDGLTGVLDDLQEISRGLHPAALAAGGLEPALAALARRSALPVTLDARIQRRLPDHIEVAAYYVSSEALANAAKHARASEVHIEAEERDGCLALHIHDDGLGGADPTQGTGLIGLRDRVEAAGGAIKVVSPTGQGTSIRVTLPTTGITAFRRPEQD